MFGGSKGGDDQCKKLEIFGCSSRLLTKGYKAQRYRVLVVLEERLHLPAFEPADKGT